MTAGLVITSYESQAELLAGGLFRTEMVNGRRNRSDRPKMGNHLYIFARKDPPYFVNYP